MKLLMMLVLLFSVIYAEEEINFKMILSSHIKSEEAAKNLYELEKFFYENKEAKTLKNKHSLVLGMKLLDKYILVAVSDIRSHEVKNKLQYLLKEKFPNSFVVAHNKTIVMSKVKAHKNATDMNPKMINYASIKRKTFFETINVEWIGLIILALIGLTLSYKSARQLSKIRELQKEIAKYHIILEDEVDRLGMKHG